MTIEYNVSEQDYLNFNLFHSNHSKYAKNTRLLLRYGAAFLILLSIFILYKDVLALIIGVVFAAAWVVLFPQYYAGLIMWSAKKMISEGKNNDFIGPQKFTLKDDGFEGVTQDSTSYTKYLAVEKICFGYECIYIYIGAIKAYIIPVTAFADAGQRDEFINMLKKKAKVEPFGVF